MAESVAAEGAPAAPSGSRNRKLLLGGVVALVLAAGAAAGLLLLRDDGAAADAGSGDAQAAGARAEPAGEPEYVTLAPAFVVNFQAGNARARYLKVEIDAVTRAPEAAQSVHKHMPAVRNALVLLLSRQSYEELMAHEGKERLRAEALAEIRAVLEAQAGAPLVEDVYFTSFVMQ